ncbi:MAG: exodeoxyribonuclease III [Ilumatobacteraceae bacterium]|nr:exodeoxyribonuclease III [Ilumatobacteraceae bacterium]
MLIVTWNVNSLKARLPRVTEWLGEVQPDVLCMQETKMTDAAFPALTFREMGYDSAHFGQGQWNGVAILSKVGLDKPRANFAVGEPDGEARIITADCGGVTVVSVYVPNGRALDHDHYKYKLRWMAQLREHAAAVSSPDGNLVIAGDYNIAPDGRDVWDEAKLQGQTHVSQAERDSLTALESWGLRDVFRDHYADAKLYSWWDYRGGDFHQGRGMRIDLMYATKAVADRTTWCGIDRNARKGEQPSDHAPVLMMLGS